MPQSWADELDTSPSFDTCSSFAGGQNSYAKPRLLQPDEASLIEDAEVALTGQARSRRGTLQLGGSVGSGSLIRALSFFKTSAVAYEVAASDTHVYKLNGSTWVQLGTQAFGASGKLNMVEGVDKLYVCDSAGTFHWDNSTWTQLDSDADTTAPRNASLVRWFTNRLIVAGDSIRGKSSTPIVPDAIYLSDLLDATSWTDAINPNSSFTKASAQIRVGGDSQPTIAMVPWTNFNLAVFKRHSVYVVVCDPTLSIADMPVQLVHGTIGCVAQRSAVQVGADILFLADDGIRSLNGVAGSDQQHELGVPLSFPVQDVINRINWQFADQSAATFWRNLYMISLPLDSSTTPNYILTFNVITGKWNGGWRNLPASCFGIRESSNSSRMMMGFATDNKVAEYLDYVTDTDATDATYTDYNGSVVLPHIRTRALTFNEPVSPKLGLGIELEWNQSKGSAVMAPVLDEVTKDPFIVQFYGTGFTFPITFPLAMPRAGVNRQQFDLMQYGEFRELQFEVQTLSAGYKELRQIIANAFVRPTLVGNS